MMARNSSPLVTKDTFVSYTLLLPRLVTDLFSTFGKESGSQEMQTRPHPLERFLVTLAQSLTTSAFSCSLEQRPSSSR